MKDFKSQSIDTPGVIDRVSALFRGHPNLIQGFNTFLPPGYRIECSLDPSDPTPIRVTTPTGTTTTRPSFVGTYSELTGTANENANANPNPNPNPNPSANANANANGSDPAIHDQLQPPHQFADGYAQPFDPANHPTEPGNSDQMNHAITYVNKIKTRFANQPDIYKQFLEILQTYQREQKPIGEVYEQVTVLFSNSPDLLDDFKQFLPDTNAPQNQDPLYNSASHLPPVGNFQPPTGQMSPTASQFNQQNYPMMAVPGETNALVNNGHSNHAGFADNEYPKKKSVSELHPYDENYNPEAQYSSLRSDPKSRPITQMVNRNGVANSTLVAGIPEPVPSSTFMKSSSLLEELNFFDKVKKAIGNKQTYNDFLKLLNLFSQDIIDKETLIDRVDSFIGDAHPELLQWFKMFVGYEDKPQSIESITFKKHQLELSLCKAYGPSYRQLPKAETYMPCSGRDEMCWEVLNDEWVGHPTWASEDSGFIAHRKNQYEEILFKIEEERLEYDYHMESNLRTIQALETIANRIANMTPEQKANFKLPPGLGQTSLTIYKKVIRKVYDKDRGFEVIDALHENPAIAVPVVLKRLKQKDEEWRRAQREWNKVWREMEQKVFYKSLDHLGLTFKQADKKLLTAKQLVSEISTVKVEQQNKRLYPLTPKPQEQLNYKFENNDILFDILRLSDVFINKSSNYSSNDREKLNQFFEFFISLFFGIPNEEIEQAMTTRVKSSDKSETSVKDISSNGKESDGNSSDSSNESPKKRPRENDLLRDVLKKQSKSRREDVEASPQVSSDSEDQEAVDQIEKSSELWISTTGKKFSLRDNETSLERRYVYNLFCNTTIYVFFRHLRTLYERLVEVKSMNDEISKEINSRKVPQFAKDLNLVSHQLKEMDVEISGTKDCYQQVLDLSERLIEGNLEHQWFEESIRQAYRNKAYKIYTIDKVVQAMVKHMHTMVTDSKTSEMMLLYEADRKTPISTAKDQILYRMQVRSLMTNDENMFKIAFKEKDSVANIQFVSLDDLTINDHKTSEEHYNYYVTSYVMSHPTEGVPASSINMPFSRDFIENVDEDQCDGYVNSGLKVSICENSYRLFFEADTFDEFTANVVYENPIDNSKPKDQKLSSLKKHLDDEEIGWKLNLGEGQNPEMYDNKLNLLFEKGIDLYNAAVINEPSEENSADDGDGNKNDDGKDELTKDVEMKDTEMKEPEDQSQENNDRSEESSGNATKSQPDATIDADMTVVQEHNDTTIQQDANDTTTDDHTVNQEEFHDQ